MSLDQTLAYIRDHEDVRSADDHGEVVVVAAYVDYGRRTGDLAPDSEQLFRDVVSRLGVHGLTHTGTSINEGAGYSRDAVETWTFRP